jgi:hypothetical protein
MAKGAGANIGGLGFNMKTGRLLEAGIPFTPSDGVTVLSVHKDRNPASSRSLKI